MLQKYKTITQRTRVGFELHFQLKHCAVSLLLAMFDDENTEQSKFFTANLSISDQLKRQCYAGSELRYLINRRCVAEQYEAEATRSAGVWVCLYCVVFNGAKLFKIRFEILCIRTHRHVVQMNYCDIPLHFER